MKKVPSYKTGNRILGDPDKPVKTTIDFSKYKDQLSKPLEGTGTNVVGNDPSGLTPEVLKSMGYKYISGSASNKDAVYEKGGNYHLYTERPNSTSNKFGIVNIGNPFAPTKQITAAPPVDNGVRVLNNQPDKPNPQPLQLGPNLNYNPNTKKYFNPITGTEIQPIVEQYSKGGKVKLPKGYLRGGDVSEDTYSAAREEANQKALAKQQQPTTIGGLNNTQLGAIASLGGQGLSAGSNFINADPNSQGIIDTNKAAYKDAAKYAGQGMSTGAAIGSFFGPEGTLIGGGIGAGAGALGGLFYGEYDANKKNAATTKALQQQQLDQLALDKTSQEQLAKSDVQTALAKRDSGESGQIATNYRAPITNTDLIPDYVDQHNNPVTKLGSGTFNLTKDVLHQGKNVLDEARNGEITAKSLKTDAVKGIDQVADIVRNPKGAVKDLNKKYFKFANGGKIEGKGTSKSDSIKAKVKEDSFVVPAENAQAAEVIRKVILKAPSGKANLNQKGGETVKLSNGEHLFTPKEVDKLESVLGEKAVDALAPDANNKEERFAQGGDVNNTDANSVESKFEKIRSEAEANLRKAYPNKNIQVVYKGKNRSLADQQKAYDSGASTTKLGLHQVGGARDFNIIIDGRVAGNKGNDFKLYKDYVWKSAEENGLHHLNEKEFGAVDPYHVSLVKETGDGTAFKTLAENYPEIANSKEFSDVVKLAESKKKANPTDTTYDSILAARDAIADKKNEVAKTDNLTTDPYHIADAKPAKSSFKPAPSLSKNQRTSAGQIANNSQEGIDWMGNNKPKPLMLNPPTTTTSTDNTPSPVAVTPKNKQAPKVTSPTTKGLNMATAQDYNSGVITPPESPVIQQASKYSLGNLDEQKAYENDMAARLTETSGTQDPTNPTNPVDKQGIDWGKALSYGIPIAQTALGLKKLKDAGARPVDQLDPETINSIASAKGNLELANQRAKYGFTPEQAAAISTQNQNLTNSGTYAARNFSGGSAGNAFALTRANLNDSYNRNLGFKAEDANLMLQKQNVVNDRQQYLDSLVSQQAERKRRLFNDKMSGWQQNQLSGAALLGAGLENLSGAARYNSELDAQKERDAKYSY